MKKPESRALLLWHIRLSLGCLCFPLLIRLFFTESPVWTAILTFLWIAFYLFMFLFYYPVKYHRLSYSFNTHALIIRCGVFYNRIKAIEFENVQHVTIGATPLQQVMHLCSIYIVGAGGMVYIPCLSLSAAHRVAARLAHLEEGGLR